MDAQIPFGVGAGPPEPLGALHQKIGQALLQAGIAADTRAFHPHVTLARLNRGTGELSHFVTATKINETFTIKHFRLFESVLARDAVDYRLIERYPLQMVN